LQTMKDEYGKLAGLLLFIGTVQFPIALIIAEALYPGYSVADNYISDLGVGPSALVFNSSVFMLGVLIVCGACLIQRSFHSRLFVVLLILAGVGTMGVGLFSENFGIIHTIASSVVFLFGGFAAIASFKLQKPPLSYLAVLLGIVALVALALFASKIYLGLGKGGMERMIAYPVLLWGVGFSGYLIAVSEHKTTSAEK